VDKAVRLAGIGQKNLVKVALDDDYRMSPDALEAAIKADLDADLRPAGLVLCTGGTGIGALDPIAETIAVARKYDLYVHVDAAWAGSAMICPEFRHLWAGVEGADSVVFNPHKWLGVQFDCSVQFIKDPVPQIKSLALRPAFLETHGEAEFVNFNEWTIPLGRRFRALKLWFVLRAYGLEGIRQRIRNHVAWIAELAEQIDALPDFEVVTQPRLALFSFRWTPEGQDSNAATENLFTAINDDGRIYLTQNTHEGKYVIRVTAGTWDATRDDVQMVLTVLKELSAQLS